MAKHSLVRLGQHGVGFVLKHVNISLRLCDSCDYKNLVDKKIFHSILIIEPVIFATVRFLRLQKFLQKRKYFNFICISCNHCDSCDSKNLADKKIFHSTLIIEPVIFATVRFLQLQKFLQKKNISISFVYLAIIATVRLL